MTAHKCNRTRGCKPEAEAKYRRSLELYAAANLSTAEICRQCEVSLKRILNAFCNDVAPFVKIERWLKVCLFVFISCLFAACRIGPVEPDSGKTTFIYFPWSTNLTPYFHANLVAMEEAIQAEGLKGGRVIVFVSTDAANARMIEISCKNGVCSRILLKEYVNPQFTTESGLTEILNDVKRFAPAGNYSMIIGSHGMGWLPVEEDNAHRSPSFKYHWNYDSASLTRFFGGLSPEYQTEISTLANSIACSGLFMDYILFDNCYMSSVEVAYEMRRVTDCMIASPTEIMAVGMPYRDMFRYLLSKTPDYNAICETFYRFYSTYDYPYGTLAVIDCRELDRLAALMKRINGLYTFDAVQESSLQRMDGYNPVVFYDYGDYVKALCGDDTGLYQEFTGQLHRTVPYKAHTESFYSSGCGAVPIHSYSGITTSEPSSNIKAQSYNQTSWYQATH